MEACCSQSQGIFEQASQELDNIVSTFVDENTTSIWSEGLWYC